MFAEKHYPDMMVPEELDAYLARGWYRMGQTIFTTHFLCFNHQFFSAVWVRLSLDGYQFRKSLRKLIRNNQIEFQTEIRRAFIDSEKEELYQKYKASFKGVLAPSLKDSLLDGEDFNIYDTMEVSVYKNKQLIATSFFDQGKDSVASIMGIYDPDYQKNSLGFYTMLMEISFCLKHELPYYYPGYIVPGYPRFDYKLRIGDVEYYDLQTYKWQAFSKLNPQDIPLTKMRNKLGLLGRALEKEKAAVQVQYYPLFEANLFGFWRAQYFDYPIMLNCLPKQSNYFLLCVFDVHENAYILYQCSPFEDLHFYFNESYLKSFDPKNYFTSLVIIDQVLEKDPTVEGIAQKIMAHLD